MDRVLFDLGIFQIKWYSFFILIALIVGGILFYKESYTGQFLKKIL